MQRKIKIESEVPCVFSDTGAHLVTMLFTEVETDEHEGLQLVHLECECGEDEAHVSEALDAGTKCCGLVRDDVRRAASGEDPRTHDPILANALKQVKRNNASLHQMREDRREPVEHVMKLARDANRALPAGFEFRLLGATGHPQRRATGAAIFAVRAWSAAEVVATYKGHGMWKTSERFEHVIDSLANSESDQIKIKNTNSYRGGMESATCLTCRVKMNPSSRKSHLESARHLKRVHARINDAMILVSERLGRRCFS